MSQHVGVAIATEGVEVTLKSGQRVQQILKQITLSVQQGMVQLLMGPSGSGKTTLLTVLAGLLTPTAGSVHLLGENFTQLSQQQQAQFRLNHLGFVFQDFNLFPALSAIENIEVALNLKGIRGRQARRQAQELLDQVGLADYAQKRPLALSGGQQQRVAIARALAGEPQLILADEPTASLDSQSGRSVMELLRKLAKDHRCTVLMVTHDPRILDLADQITYLEDGEIVDQRQVAERSLSCKQAEGRR
jgi:putative ABC transport system ATP-binding protein